MQVTEINIYPVKSTRSIALQHCDVEMRGLQYDRRWMLVDGDNRFVTARQQPMLATVETAITDNALTIRAEGRDALMLPLQPESIKQMEVTVWRSVVNSVAIDERADEWFSDFLGQSVRLVMMPDTVNREVDQDYGQSGDHVSFADGFPLLLISAASLDDLNTRLNAPVSMRRFRPNIVVSGCDPYAEDSWKEIRINGVVFVGVKACSRCIFTTIDPATGIKSPDQEPLRTLATYRKQKGGVFFGQNLIPRKTGVIHVGDEVIV
ncbi:MAG: MOSC domain-containing protein [Gammaproteobacteria bacterium]